MTISKTQRELRQQLNDCDDWLIYWAKFAKSRTVKRMWALRSRILKELLKVQTREHRR